MTDLTAIENLARDAKERAEKATPGPWVANGQENYGSRVVSDDAHGVTIGWFGENGAYTKAGFHVVSSGEAGANAVLCAASRTDVPALADAVLQLVQRVRELENGQE
jgi:hypothetical protein